MKRITVAIAVLLGAATPALGAYPDLVVPTGVYGTTTIHADGSSVATINNPNFGPPYTQAPQPATPGAPGYIRPGAPSAMHTKRHHCGTMMIDDEPYIVVPKKRATCEDLDELIPSRKNRKRVEKRYGWVGKEWTCNPKSNDIKCRFGRKVFVVRELDDDEYERSLAVSRDGLVECGLFSAYTSFVSPNASSKKACAQQELVADSIRAGLFAWFDLQFGAASPLVAPAGCVVSFDGISELGGYVITCNPGTDMCIITGNGPSGDFTMIRGVTTDGYYRRIFTPSPC